MTIEGIMQNAQNTVIQIAGVVILIVIIVALVKEFQKRNYAQMVVTGIVGIGVLIFTIAPNLLTDLANLFKTAIFG